MSTRTAAAFAAALFLFALAVPPPVRAAGELVLDGETVADAATYAAAKREGKVTLYSTTRPLRPTPRSPFRRPVGSTTTSGLPTTSPTATP